MDKSNLIDGGSATVMTPNPAQEYCLFFLNQWPTCMTKSEWSGWAQAVFSVLAIIAAILIARAQHNADKRQREADEMKAAITFGWSIIHLIQPFLKSIFALTQSLEKAEDDQMRLSVLKRLHEALSYAKLPSEHQLTGILSIPGGASKQVAIGVGQMGQLLVFLNMFFDPATKYPGPPIKISQYVENEVAVAKVHLEKAIALILEFQKLHPS